MLGWFRKEKEPDVAPSWHLAAQFAARARWISQACTTTLLDELGWTEQPKTYGWSAIEAA